jgi:hypothetical protein
MYKPFEAALIHNSKTNPQHLYIEFFSAAWKEERMLEKRYATGRPYIKKKNIFTAQREKNVLNHPFRSNLNKEKMRVLHRSFDMTFKR